MPAKATPRLAPTAEALYDKFSRKLWMEYPSGAVVQLGSADHAGHAQARLKELGLQADGCWTTSYGALRSCLVGVPEEWSPPTLR